MIDTHCHLTDPRLSGQLSQVLARAAEHGITRCITIGTSPSDGIAAREISRRFESVLFAVGIHPSYTGPFQPGDVHELRPLLADPRCVALGEIGLEYHWKDVPREHQKRMFRAQLALAADLGKPVILHSRQAIADTLAILAEFPGVRAVFHCFSGTPEEARTVVAGGYLIGLDGPLTFKRNDTLRSICADVPADRLLIETDCPYMTPEPHRAVKVNEPMYVRCVLETLARVRGIGLAEADALTTSNAIRLFGETI